MNSDLFIYLQPWRWKQYVSPKRWHLPTSLRGAKTQKNNITIHKPVHSYRTRKNAKNPITQRTTLQTSTDYHPAKSIEGAAGLNNIFEVRPYFQVSTPHIRYKHVSNSVMFTGKYRSWPNASNKYRVPRRSSEMLNVLGYGAHNYHCGI
jgi:hypothetical protein